MNIFKSEISEISNRRVILGLSVKDPKEIFSSVRQAIPQPCNEYAHKAKQKALCGIYTRKITEADFARRGEVLILGLPLDWTLGPHLVKFFYGQLQPGVLEALLPFTLEGHIGSFEFIPWENAKVVNLNFKDSTGIASYSVALLDWDKAMQWYKDAVGQTWEESEHGIELLASRLDMPIKAERV